MFCGAFDRVQCCTCAKWRIVSYEASQAARDDSEWSCRKIRPPYSSCHMPQTKQEVLGGHYAARGADWEEGGPDAAGGSDVWEYDIYG
jgi:CW-type Zinc Finger